MGFYKRSLIETEFYSVENTQGAIAQNLFRFFLEARNRIFAFCCCRWRQGIAVLQCGVARGRSALQLCNVLPLHNGNTLQLGFLLPRVTAANCQPAKPYR
jgi:hypothetical protein